MTLQLDIPKADLDDWLGTLKPYQSNTLKAFLKTLSPEEAAQKWISSTGSPQVAQFGGRSDPQPYWDAFKRATQAAKSEQEEESRREEPW